MIVSRHKWLSALCTLMATAIALSCVSSVPAESERTTTAARPTRVSSLKPEIQPLPSPAIAQPSASPVSAKGPSSASGTVSGCPPEGTHRVTRRQRGKATYYGDKFQGRKTASGERYQQGELTAAHRSLPFGTRVRVRRLDGNKEQVCVRINDRGPYAGPSRIIDVSKSAARALSMLQAGVVMVELEVLQEKARSK